MLFFYLIKFWLLIIISQIIKEQKEIQDITSINDNESNNNDNGNE